MVIDYLIRPIRIVLIQSVLFVIESFLSTVTTSIIIISYQIIPLTTIFHHKKFTVSEREINNNTKMFIFLLILLRSIHGICFYNFLFEKKFRNILIKLIRRVKKDSNGTTTTILSTHIQWYWKSRRDPWASIDVNEWEPYSDDQNRIIEKAFRNNAEYVNLKESDYIIDLKRLIQMNARDSTKQPPIKRVNLEDQSHPTN
ncbi:unnamed protein product [Rotaria sp. Silwood1]|nr:unnamed protein product [Rotaria sp. Silwood1]